jgi:tRNA pseudouridine38-40 synthase
LTVHAGGGEKTTATRAVEWIHEMTSTTGHGVLLWLAYDGTPFSGMALQTNGRTVAGELLGAIHTMDPRASVPRQVSRTDRGVHALGQIVAFDTTKDISPRGWLLGLTKHLPSSIAVVRAARVPFGFDPRGYVVDKTYRYRILQSPVRDPFLDTSAWRIAQRLNHDLMNEETSDLLGTHDFRAFRGAQDLRSDTMRTIQCANWSRDSADPRALWFEIKGDRFLYHMVRIIVGTLVDVGRGRTNRGAVRTALASFRREDLGITAPAQGLFLSHIQLNNQGTEHWPSVDETRGES